MKSFIRTNIIFILIGILYGCDQDSNINVEENNLYENEIISSLKLLLEEDKIINDITNTFEAKYGLIDFENVIILDEKSESILFQVYQDGIVKHWLSGFKDDDGMIQFYINSIERIDKYEISSRSSANTSKSSTNINSFRVDPDIKYVRVKEPSDLTASFNCYTTSRYRRVCGYYDANENGEWDANIDGPLQCRDVFVGSSTTCVQLNEITDVDPNLELGGGGGGWHPPFDTSNTAVPCVGNPIKKPRVAPQTNSGIQGGMFGMTRTYGTQMHSGLDLKAGFGSPIYAMYDGNATLQYQKNKAGYFVVIDSYIDNKNVKTMYFHLQEYGRISGPVKAGDIIGYLGDSGNLKASIEGGYGESHLHIKVKENNKVIDPRKYLTTKINDDGSTDLTTDC